MKFCLTQWLSSLVFPDSSRMQASSTCCEVSEHTPCHGVESFYSGALFKNCPNDAEVSLTAGSKGKHEVTKDLLVNVEDVEV